MYLPLSRTVARLPPLRASLTTSAPVTRTAALAVAHFPALTCGAQRLEHRRVGVLARKVGMLNLWDGLGARHAVTVLCVDRCHVLSVHPPHVLDRRGRWGVQVGAGPVRPYKAPKALRFHCAKAGVEPKDALAEFLVEEGDVVPVGEEITAAWIAPGQFVDVRGVSIGKGFQGPMKRWGFKGGGASHGNSKAHRSHGSTGQSTAPGRTFPGKKMAGRMGGDNVTVQSLRVVRVDEGRNLIFVRGAVPGNKGNWVRVRDAWRKGRVEIDEEAVAADGEEKTGVADWEGFTKGLAAAL